MNKPNLLERLLILFSKKRFKQYINEETYYRYKDSIEKLEVRTKELETKTENIFRQTNNTKCKGIVHSDFNEMKFTIVERNGILPYCSYENLDESLQNEAKTFLVKERVINNMLNRIDYNVNSFDIAKRELADKIAESLVEEGYITYDINVDEGSFFGEDSLKLTAKLKVF